MKKIKRELLYFCLPLSSKAATCCTAWRRIFFFFAERKEAVPKVVCGVDIDGCGAGDETTGVPGSAEPRREMGVGLHFSNTSKCYNATLFISHVSILLCSLHRLFTPDSQSFLMEILGVFSFVLVLVLIL